MLTLITPTGARPYAFELCQRMMARQTYNGPVRWIIVDDGEVPSEITIQRAGWTIEIIRPQPLWRPGDNTQGRNLIAAMQLVSPDDAVVFFEDDDHYHSNWLSEVALQLEKAELVGEGNALYYNVRTRKYRFLGNDEHASLRCSAIRGKALDTFRAVLQTPYRYYDQRLWKAHPDRYVFMSRLTIGIKGMPGRPGIALGHDGLRGNDDRSGDFLRSMIGSDADWYSHLYEELSMSDEKWIVTKKLRYNRKDYMPGDEFIPVKRIDAELFEHARKIERRSAQPAAPNPQPEKPKKLKVESQTLKLKETVVEKAPEPVSEKLAEDFTPPAPPTIEEEPSPMPRKKSFGI